MTLQERIEVYREKAKHRKIKLKKIVVHPDDYREACKIVTDIPVESLSTCTTTMRFGQAPRIVKTIKNSEKGTRVEVWLGPNLEKSTWV